MTDWTTLLITDNVWLLYYSMYTAKEIYSLKIFFQELPGYWVDLRFDNLLFKIISEYTEFNSAQPDLNVIHWTFVHIFYVKQLTHT